MNRLAASSIAIEQKLATTTIVHARPTFPERLSPERRTSQPWGLDGGEPGAPGENWLLPGGDESAAERLPDKCTIRVRAGDVLRMLTPGGGGLGSNRPKPSEPG